MDGHQRRRKKEEWSRFCSVSSTCLYIYFYDNVVAMAYYARVAMLAGVFMTRGSVLNTSVEMFFVELYLR